MTNEVARVYEQLMQLRAQSRWVEAMPVAETLVSLTVECSGETSTNTTHAIHLWAWLVQENGDYDKAEELWLRALAIDERLFGKDAPETTRRMHMLGGCYRDQGRYDEAAGLFHRALAIRERFYGPDHSETGQIVKSLGVLDEKLGNYASAEINLLRALAIFEKEGVYAEAAAAGVVSALGWLYGVIGDFERRAQLMHRALESRKKIYGLEHVYTASSYYELAMVHQAAGQLDKAAQLFRESLAIREKLLGTNHILVADSLSALGTTCMKQQDLARAEPLLRRACSIVEQNLGVGHPQFASALLTLARLEKEKGKLDVARGLIARAYAINEKRMGTTHRSTLSCLRQLAWLDAAEGHRDKALAVCDRLQQSEEEMLANVLSFTSERQRLAFQRDCSPFQQRYDLWATLGAPTPLLRASLRTKGVVLDSLIEDRLLAEAAGDSQVRQLLREITTCRRRLAEAALPVSCNAKDPGRRADPATISDQVEALEASLARRVSGVGYARRALSVRTDEVLSALPEDAALLEMLRYQDHSRGGPWEEKYGLLVVSRNNEPQWVCLGAAQPIDRAIKLFGHAIRSPNAGDMLTHSLRDLHSRLWAPLVQHLPERTRRIIVCPDGELNFVSFAALLTPSGHFLGEDYLFSYISSGRDLLVENSSHDCLPELWIWANPDFGCVAAAPTAPGVAGGHDFSSLSFRSLPGAEKEARAVLSLAPQLGFSNAFLYTGRDASEAKLHCARSPEVLHMATHGFFLPQLPMPTTEDEHAIANLPTAAPNPMLRSGLALAGAERTLRGRAEGKRLPPEDDGLLTAEEIGCLDLRGTHLVILSACDTGAGEARCGEGILGLRRGFIRAGAQNLLLTLWPIDDEQTGGFMPDFYVAMRKGASPSHALAEVQRAWLARLRREKGTAEACQVAGAFILSFQGRPE
jgi:CHAT domain-containing protein/tetratricopeptide (TPR) repeat protein